MKLTLTFALSLAVRCLFAQSFYIDEDYADGAGYVSPPFESKFNNSQSHFIIVGGFEYSYHLGYTEIEGNQVFSCAAVSDLGYASLNFGQSVQTAIGSEYSKQSIEGADFYPNGKLLLCGTFYDESYPNHGAAVFRMNTNGTLDETFANDQTISFHQTDSANHDITAIGCRVLQNNNAIAAFTYEDSTVVKLVLVKYNSNGDVDLNFDEDGIKYVTLSDSLRITDIFDDGTKLFLCGTKQGMDSKIAVVLKMDEYGNFSYNFGNGTDAEIGNSSDEYFPQALFVSYYGDVYTTGYTGSGSAFVSKMNQYGQMDNTFGTNGSSLYVSSTQPVGLDIAMTPQQQIMIVGKLTDANGLSHSFMARFTADGVLDDDFANDGVFGYPDYYVEFNLDEDVIMGIHVLDDGDILTTGYAYEDDVPYRYICAKWHTYGAGVENVSSSVPEVFPNPVSDELFIRTHDYNTTAIQITDGMGNIVLSTNITSPQTRIDVSSFSAGVYHLTLTDYDGNRKVRKVVKG